MTILVVLKTDADFKTLHNVNTNLETTEFVQTPPVQPAHLHAQPHLPPISSNPTPIFKYVRIALMAILLIWSILLLFAYWLDFFSDEWDDGLDDLLYMSCFNVIAFTGINLAMLAYSLINVNPSSKDD